MTVRCSLIVSHNSKILFKYSLVSRGTRVCCNAYTSSIATLAATQQTLIDLSSACLVFAFSLDVV